MFCVRADDAARGTARVPAVARAGEVAVAVSAGADPRRAAAVRAAVAAALDAGDLPLRHHRPARSRAGCPSSAAGPGTRS